MAGRSFRGLQVVAVMRAQDSAVDGSADASRALVAFDPIGRCAEHLETSTFQGWKTWYVDRADDAREIVQREGILVGIAVIDRTMGKDLAQLEALGADGICEWIAIANAESIADSVVRNLVVRLFHDYHTWPVDSIRLRQCIGHAWGKARLRRDAFRDDSQPEQYGMIGRSAPMLALYRRIERIVQVDAPVLIAGESGSGKELVARAIHRHSLRSKGPFVAVNCGAFPSGLIQSELFGHERGAFTGAHQRKTGSIEAASGGVLFLDEIGDLPIEHQVNLLRVLQERIIHRVGSTQAIDVDLRVVAASHVDLQQAVDAGRFREDLHYRLNVLHVEVPPLRDRGADIALLAERLFQRFASERRGNAKGFGDDALRALEAHHWPGNVRELANRVHQAVVMSERRLLSAADLGLASVEDSPGGHSLSHARLSLDRSIIDRSLRMNGNNVTRTARQLGISRVTLHRMLNRLNIRA